MITLNGKKFVINDKQAAETLFNSGGTFTGFYRPLRNKIKLFNTKMELIGVITKHGVLVSAILQDNGKYWYSYASISEIGKFDTYMIDQNDIRAALDKLAA